MIKDTVFLNNLPNKPGIYQMLGADDQILYVGKARDLKKRVTSYFSSKEKDLKTSYLLKAAVRIEITITHTEHEALLLECFLIKEHQPHYNVLLRDDKSYPYILITDDKPYPRITFYRGLKKGKGLYFGPYPNATAVRETLHIIQKVFHLRSCDNRFFSSRKRPCLHYQIGLCSGSCTGLISEKEYQENISHAILFLKGKSQLIIHELEKKMAQAANALNFEFAAKVRDQIQILEEIQAKQYISTEQKNADIIGLVLEAGVACIHLLSIREGRLLGSRSYFPKVPMGASEHEIVSAFIGQHYLGCEDIPHKIIVGEDIEDKLFLEETLKIKIIKPFRGERRKWLEMAESNAKQSVASYLIQKTNVEARLQALQKALSLQIIPNRMECFDISHTHGEETVASCVVFNQEGPVKSDYRRFNISNITPGDDLAAMRQVLERRFKRIQEEGKPLPDLVFIDGGKLQLKAAKSVLEELHIKEILLVGISKGEGRKPGLETLHFLNRSPLHLSSDSIALHFIQQIRDEAHRFAITGHRLRRDKKRRTSILESIPGIGAKRRRALIRHFGGLQALRAASIEQILEVPHMTRGLAEQVHESLASFPKLRLTE